MKIFRILLASIVASLTVLDAQAEMNYQSFKSSLSKKYGFDYNIDISVLGQRTSPSGKNNAVQAYIYPEFSWTMTDSDAGTGVLNFAYSVVRYGGHNAADIASNSGMVTGINDYTDNATEFNELYYTYQFGGKWDWLTLGIGQYSLYNFDGTEYDSNQQVNFLNDSLAQNASASYSSGGLGGYVQIQPSKDWNIALGGLDASNIDATSIRANHLDDGHYTTFGYVAYSPIIHGVGELEISLMLYNQPGVSEQPETTNGWSLNLSQNIGDKFNIFARVNGVSGAVEEISQSWVLGGVYNNPLNRNPLDQIGLAYSYNKIDKDAVGEELAHNAEQIVEAYWAWGVGDMLTITPDVQLYINPALNAKTDLGIVTSIRATVFF